VGSGGQKEIGYVLDGRKEKWSQGPELVRERGAKGFYEALTALVSSSQVRWEIKEGE